MNWGSKIVLTFIVFIAIMATMVIISMRQNVNLVADDYYAQEIAYEDQINRIKNTKALESAPVILFEKEKTLVKLDFQKSSKPFKKGELLLFRPSDRYQDVKAKIKLDENGQFRMSVNGHAPGLWIVKINWSDGEKEYYAEKQVVL